MFTSALELELYFIRSILKGSRDVCVELLDFIFAVREPE